MTQKFLFALMVLFWGIIPSKADDNNNGNGNGGSNDDDPIVLTRRSVPDPKKGPRMPSNQVVWFSYNGASEECSVTLTPNIEWATVTIEQIPVGFYYVGDVSQEDPTISVAIPSGHYRIPCTSDEGATFIGEGDIN